MEFILQDDMTTDITLNHVSSNLQTTAIVVIGLFAIFSILFNMILLITILLSRKLRSVQLFILFCNLAILNILDIVSGMFIPLLFIINANWLFNMTLCRWNATLEQFIDIEVLMSMMLMAIERSILSYFPNQLIFKHWRTLAFIIVLWTISICLAIPMLTHHIPVRPFEFRFNCNISRKVPILYPIVYILIYVSCLIIILICFAALLSRNNQYKNQSLPTRCNFEVHRNNLNLSKLVLFLIILFILLNGPYIILNFFIQIRNSNKILKDDYAFNIPHDGDIILNWLRFMYPLLAPILIYASCAEIWLNVQRFIFCHKSEAVQIRRYSNERDRKEITIDHTSNDRHTSEPVNVSEIVKPMNVPNYLI
ncbi:7 transmembrane receptor (rhodopsin family) protein [Acanthocheilonema viteae]